MAKRIRSGLKRKRQAVKRTARNQAVRSEIRTLVKKAREAASPGPEDVLAAVRALDAAGRKGIIHPNTAARKKSRLMRHLSRQASASA